MDFGHRVTPAQSLVKLEVDALVLVVAAGSLDSGLEAPLADLLADAVAQGDLALKKGKTLYLHRPAGFAARRVVVSVAADASAKSFKSAVAHALVPLKNGGARSLAVGWAVVRHNFYAVLPLAYDLIYTSMSDAALVLDSRQRIVRAADERDGKHGNDDDQRVEDRSKECRVVVEERVVGEPDEAVAVVERDRTPELLAVHEEVAVREQRALGLSRGAAGVGEGGHVLGVGRQVRLRVAEARVAAYVTALQQVVSVTPHRDRILCLQGKAFRELLHPGKIECIASDGAAGIRP